MASSAIFKHSPSPLHHRHHQTKAALPSWRTRRYSPEYTYAKTWEWFQHERKESFQHLMQFLERHLVLRKPGDSTPVPSHGAAGVFADLIIDYFAPFTTWAFKPHIIEKVLGTGMSPRDFLLDGRTKSVVDVYERWTSLWILFDHPSPPYVHLFHLLNIIQRHCREDTRAADESLKEANIARNIAKNELFEEIEYVTKITPWSEEKMRAGTAPNVVYKNGKLEN
jgi:hypothetical protein